MAHRRHAAQWRVNEWINEGTNTGTGTHTQALQLRTVCSLHTLGHLLWTSLQLPHARGSGVRLGLSEGQLGLSFQIPLLCSADVKFMLWNSKKENNGILFHWLFKICSVPKGWIYKHYWKRGNGCQEFLSFVSAWARIWLLLLQIMGWEILLLDTCWKF